jgi:drug/metabolite transporter (DMT)-like permease
MALLIVLAAAFWGLGSFLAQRLALPGDPLVTTGWQMLFGGALFAVCGLVAGEGGRVDVAEFSTKSILAFAYLVLIGSIVAFSAYAYALAHAPISQVSTYAYVNPVIAVVLGALLLGEHVAAVTIAGMALIVASVLIVVRREARGGRDARELHETTEHATVQVASRN